jgi:hypothetical protein
MDKVLESRVSNLRNASVRLRSLHAHDALVILKHSLSLPKLLHNLRSSPCIDHPALLEFDELLRSCLSSILNVSLDDDQWSQASLPVNNGGLEIRRTHQLAPSAFLASAHGVAPIVSNILPDRFHGVEDPFTGQALSSWSKLCSSPMPTGSLLSSQRAWDRAVITQTSDYLLSTAADDYTRARLRAASAPHSGDWLKAPPITAIGLRMSDEVIRVATGLRLGANLCAPHRCRCDALVDARGSHGLSCYRSAGRHMRHSLINDIVHRALVRAGIAAVKEPNGLLPASSLRPDGTTLIPWAAGKCLAWDATTPDTLAASHLSSTSGLAGAAAEHASIQKNQKYSSLSPSHHFVAIAIETLGAWNSEGLSFIKELGRRTTLITSDPRESSYIIQRISVAVQRGNVASFTGSLPLNTGFPELDEPV